MFANFISGRARAVTAGCLAGLMLCGAMATMPVGIQDEAVDGLTAPSVAWAKGSTTKTSIVKNGTFTISASDFVDRMDAGFKEIDALTEDCNLKASGTKSYDDKTFDMDIKKGSKLVGFARFSKDKGDSEVSYAQRNISNGSFSRVTISIFDTAETSDIGYITLAATMAADPTLTLSDAVELMTDCLESIDVFEDYGGAVKNGITYLLARTSTGCLFAIDCSNS